jgi:hypothetical protein
MEIAIPFAQVEAINPNISNPNCENPATIYFKCILVCFATFRHFEPEATLVLYTNKPITIEFENQFQNLRIDIRIIPFTFNPPNIMGDRFRGCFFLFDAIKNSKATTLFIDPDIVAINRISEVEGVCGNRYGIFKLDFSENTFVNGITLGTATRIFDRYYGNTYQFATEKKTGHLGGEIIYIPSSRLKEINEKISNFWTWNLNEALSKRDYLTTEEHILTQTINDNESVKLNSFISRIWTTKKFTKHQGNEGEINDLALWHLPAEKSRGFIKLYSQLYKSEFKITMDHKEFKETIKKIMNIDRKSNLFISYLYSLKSSELFKKF